MEHRRDGEKGRFGMRAAPQLRSGHGDHDRAMRVHAGLRLARRAGRVRQHAEIVGCAAVRCGRPRVRQRFAPARHAARQGLAVAAPPDPLRSVVARVVGCVVIGQGIAIAMHDDLPQRRRAHERGDCPEQLACGERGHGAAILDDMAQLVFEQHGVCRHHDRIRAQDREIRGDELRTVLAEDHDAVAALHAAHVLEIAGQPLHLVQQLAVRDRAAVKVDDDLLRKAPRRDFRRR